MVRLCVLFVVINIAVKNRVLGLLWNAVVGLVLLLLFTATDFPLGGSSPYTSTDILSNTHTISKHSHIVKTLTHC
jgi:hypothetical protein